ncbi:MAG: enoyl-CoA hydratase-related protein [Alphaproteobacteria bacterium]|nr:enoyl-CoA hydratase-related protein [Alphaproteobacteria bacterium]
MTDGTPFETILFSIDGKVATITLNRPDVLNAFVERMHLDIHAALDRAVAAGVRAVVLTGAGRAFSAGQDLKALDQDDHGRIDIEGLLERTYHETLRRLRSPDYVTIAAVNGVAAGASCNIALACDIVIAGKSAQFVEAFARIGLIPDAGGTWVLPRLIGRARALGMILTTDPIDAETARDWGMIWQVAQDEALMETAAAMAQKLAAGPGLAYGMAKRAIDASIDNDFETQLKLEACFQQKAADSKDFAEGVKAFTEKRRPSFKNL